MIFQQPFNDPLNYVYFSESFSKEEINEIIKAAESLKYYDAKVSELHSIKSDEDSQFSIDENAIALNIEKLLENEKCNLDIDEDSDGVIEKELRSSKIKWVPYNEEWNWVYERIMSLIYQANTKLWKFDISKSEPIQYTEYYDYEKGHYNWHHDFGSGLSSHRKISVSVQLSDPSSYDGGDLQLQVGGGQIDTLPKELGQVIIFPSYFLHRVTPVTSGTRKSLVMWVGGNHFR
jgi:PKHD-type hydroxylase